MNILAEIRDMVVIHTEYTGERPKKIKLGKKQLDRVVQLDSLLLYKITREDALNLKKMYKMDLEWTDHDSLMVMK